RWGGGRGVGAGRGLAQPPQEAGGARARDARKAKASPRHTRRVGRGRSRRPWRGVAPIRAAGGCGRVGAELVLTCGPLRPLSSSPYRAAGAGGRAQSLVSARRGIVGELLRTVLSSPSMCTALLG